MKKILLIVVAMFAFPIMAQAEEVCWPSETAVSAHMDSEYQERLIGKGESSKGWNLLVYASDDGSFSIAYQHAADVTCVEMRGNVFKKPDVILPKYTVVNKNNKDYFPSYIGIFENAQVFMLYLYDSGEFDVKMLMVDSSDYVGNVISGKNWLKKGDVKAGRGI